MRPLNYLTSPDNFYGISKKLLLLIGLCEVQPEHVESLKTGEFYSVFSVSCSSFHLSPAGFAPPSLPLTNSCYSVTLLAKARVSLE